MGRVKLPMAPQTHAGQNGLRLRYDADVAALSPRQRAAFVRLSRDAGTEAFLAEAEVGRHAWARTRLHRMLRFFVSDFDANGMLGMYALHVASTEQWRTLLGPAPVERMLDIGAGSGGVTRRLSPLVRQVVTTELSGPMARSLRRMGFECHQLDITEQDLPEPRPAFDLVSCLNVLDRTARPRHFLRRLVDLLEPGGRLLIALVLPYRPFYYAGAETPEPLERLACNEPEWEAAVNTLLERELEPLGLTLERLSRVPYLSFGDTDRGLYELDDAILVLRKSRSSPA